MSRSLQSGTGKRNQPLARRTYGRGCLFRNDLGATAMLETELREEEIEEIVFPHPPHPKLSRMYSWRSANLEPNFKTQFLPLTPIRYA